MSETLTEAAPVIAEPVATEEAATTTTGVDTTATVTAPEPAAAAWDDPAIVDLVDQRSQALFEERMAPLVPLLERLLTNEGDPNAGTEALNPWDENFGGSLDQRFQAMEQRIGGMLERVAAPLAAREQAETTAQGEQRLQDILADEVARNGDFASDPETGHAPGKELVRPLADLFFPEFQQRFGSTPRAAEFAMAKAAGAVRQIEAVVAKTALAKETNRLSTLAGVNGEPGVAGVAVATATDGRPLSGHELAAKYGGKALALRGAPTG